MTTRRYFGKPKGPRPPDKKRMFACVVGGKTLLVAATCHAEARKRFENQIGQRLPIGTKIEKA